MSTQLPFKPSPEELRMIEDQYQADLREIEQDRKAQDAEHAAHQRNVRRAVLLWAAVAVVLGLLYLAH